MTNRFGFTCLVVMLMTLVVWPSTSQAQSNDDFQTWSAFIATGAPADRAPNLFLWFDGHVRRGAPGTTVIVRPGVGYALFPWMSVWAGYAWVPVIADGPGRRVDEHRVWQQVILTSSWLNGTLKAQSRTRFEQRFHDASSDYGLRLRQFLRLDYRFGRTSDWGVVVWDELFWGLNDPGFAPEGYDQNRLFVGPAFFAGNHLRVEAGYLWANLNRGTQGQNQHVLALNFFTSF